MIIMPEKGKIKDEQEVTRLRWDGIVTNMKMKPKNGRESNNLSQRENREKGGEV